MTLSITEKGIYVYRRAQELICEGATVDRAMEIAEKEADELESAGAWRNEPAFPWREGSA